MRTPGRERGGQTLHFEVLVAFTATETEFFGVVTDKHDPVAWIYGTRAAHPVLSAQSNPRETKREKRTPAKWETQWTYQKWHWWILIVQSLLRLLAPWWVVVGGGGG